MRLLAREGAGADRGRAGRGGPACWRRRASAAARTGGCWSGSSETGDIFFARSDEPWVLAGANVHISFVGQDDGSETERELDGQPVAAINANLTHGRRPDARATASARTSGSRSSGDTKGGPFEIDDGIAAAMLGAPEPGRPTQPRRRPAVGERPRPHRPAARHVDHRLRRRHAGDGGCALRGAVRVRSTSTSGPLATGSERRRLRRALVAPRRAASGDARALSRPGSGTSRRRSVTKHRLFVWLDAAVLAGQRSSSSSPATTTTRSASSTRASTSCGPSPPGRSCETPASATPRPPASRPSRSRAPPTSSARRSPRPPASSSASATAGSTRPASTRPTSPSGPSPTSTTSGPPGSPTPTPLSTPPSSPPTAGPRTSPTDEILARLLELNLERDPA